MQDQLVLKIYLLYNIVSMVNNTVVYLYICQEGKAHVKFSYHYVCVCVYIYVSGRISWKTMNYKGIFKKWELQNSFTV